MIRILVIDDDEDVRNVIQCALQDEGFDVDVASDGVEGMAKIGNMSVDLVITDIFMPEKDGLEIMRDLRRIAPGTKIIAISGRGLFPEDSFQPVAKGLGAHIYLKKPFSPQSLIKAVNQAIAS